MKILDFYYRSVAWLRRFRKANPVFWLIDQLVSLVVIIFIIFAFKHSVLDANNIPSGSMEPTLHVGDFVFVNNMQYDLRFPYTDHVLAMISEPKRGDIITFKPPAGSDVAGSPYDWNLTRSARILHALAGWSGVLDKKLVKRLIALPGDRVRVADNQIFINEVPYPLAKPVNDQDPHQLDTRCPEFQDIKEEEIRDPKTGDLIIRHRIIQHYYQYVADSVSAGQKCVSQNHSLISPRQTWKIPEGYVMVMGDNRSNSTDSRSCQMDARRMDCENAAENGQRDVAYGLIPRDRIYGKVFMTYFSVNFMSSHLRGEVNPFTDLALWIRGQRPDAYVRWNRIFKRIF